MRSVWISNCCLACKHIQLLCQAQFLRQISHLHTFPALQDLKAAEHSAVAGTPSCWWTGSWKLSTASMLSATKTSPSTTSSSMAISQSVPSCQVGQLAQLVVVVATGCLDRQSQTRLRAACAAGVLQIEAMAQLGGLVMLDPNNQEAKEQFFFGGIEGCRFRRPVVPGDTLVRRQHVSWVACFRAGAVKGVLQTQCSRFTHTAPVRTCRL